MPDWDTPMRRGRNALTQVGAAPHFAAENETDTRQLMEEGSTTMLDLEADNLSSHGNPARGSSARYGHGHMNEDQRMSGPCKRNSGRENSRDLLGPAHLKYRRTSDGECEATSETADVDGGVGDRGASSGDANRHLAEPHIGAVGAAEWFRVPAAATRASATVYSAAAVAGAAASDQRTAGGSTTVTQPVLLLSVPGDGEPPPTSYSARRRLRGKQRQPGPLATPADARDASGRPPNAAPSSTPAASPSSGLRGS